MRFIEVVSYLLLFLSCYGGCSSDQVSWLVRKWSPLIWLAPDEDFMPMDVDGFLRNVYTSDENGTVIQIPWDQEKDERKTKGLYLLPKTPLDKLLNDSRSFVFGRNPVERPVPIYAIVTDCPVEATRSNASSLRIDNSSNRNVASLYFHVTYWTFYPFNRGKDLCFIGKVPTLQLLETCLGDTKSIGNHLGDWERVSLYFAGKPTPERLYLGVHSVGAYYKYDPASRSFVFDSKVVTEGVTPLPKFPSRVRTDDSGRPVLFSASGSHGLWAAAGEFEYVKVPRLTDSNGYGTPWKTWEKLEMYTIGKDPLPAWMTYKGKWGNPKKNCILWNKLGLCEYTEGPSGVIRSKKDFYCWS